jgi:hypothetical protein
MIMIFTLKLFLRNYREAKIFSTLVAFWFLSRSWRRGNQRLGRKNERGIGVLDRVVNRSAFRLLFWNFDSLIHCNLGPNSQKIEADETIRQNS